NRIAHRLALKEETVWARLDELAGARRRGGLAPPARASRGGDRTRRPGRPRGAACPPTAAGRTGPGRGGEGRRPAGRTLAPPAALERRRQLTNRNRGAGG